MEKPSARELNELHQLDDEALVSTREAAAFLGFSYDTLRWIRTQRPCQSPKYRQVGRRAVRYCMGDLRAFANGDPNAFQAPRSTEG